MFLDVNRREIQLGDKLADVSGEWYADDETPVVESEGDELCIFMIHRGTDVCLLRLRIGYCYLLRPRMGYIRLIM